ncbi:MAG TPA: hypothetical protein VMH34_08635 [Gammaproteobacteria bacterium]|nr:hypothetical protein [Gammaproteobacteria bacterium]
MSLETAVLSRNLGRFETALVVILTSILATVFYHRVQRLEADMDHAAIDLMINQVSTQLLIFESELTMTGKTGQLAEYDGRNPFERIFSAPPNYAGEIDGDRPTLMAPGHWYFDKKNGQIIYRVVNDRYFKGGLPGPGRIRIRLSLKYEDVNGNGRYDAGVDQIQGLVLKKLDRYEWTEK